MFYKFFVQSSINNKYIITFSKNKPKICRVRLKIYSTDVTNDIMGSKKSNMPIRFEI